MAERWNVTLIDDAGNEHVAVLTDVVGSVDQPDWRGILSIGTEGLSETSQPTDGSTSPEVSLRMNDGDDEGRIAHVKFTGASEAGAQVYGLSGFINPSP